MNNPQIRRISLFQNCFSLSTSPQKFHQAHQTTANSETIVKINSTCNLNANLQISDHFDDRITEWRKNAHPMVVGVKNCEYSSVRTPTKFINIPAQFQVEKMLAKLDSLSNVSMGQSIFILSCLLEGYNVIKGFLGHVAIDLRFCGITSDGRVKVWINSNFKNNHSEGNIIKDQSEAVLKIIQEIKKISVSRFSQFYCYYLRNARKNICDFKYTLSLLKSYCSCTKLTLPEKLNIKPANEKITMLCSFKEPSISISNKKHRGSLSPQFGLKIPLFLKDNNFRPISTLKQHKSSPFDSKIGQNFSEKLVAQQKRPSSIAKQFSLTLSPSKKSIKNSSTTHATLSNMNSTHFQDNIQGLDWALKTFRKMAQFPAPHSQFKNEKSQTQAPDQSTIMRRQKQQEIVRKNQWINKISNLFQNSEVKESQIVGREPQALETPKNTQKLDKLAKAISQSVVPSNQHNF